MSQYLYFALNTRDGSLSAPAAWEESHRVNLWKPRAELLARQWPSKFVAGCWLLDRLRLFANGDCRFLTVEHLGRQLHHCAAYPGFWRFPFMAAGDLQIGWVWTDPEFRSRGLAARGVAWLMRLTARPGRTFWYVVSRDNAASIRVASKVGFVCVGEGSRRRVPGLPFRTFRIDSVHAAPCGVKRPTSSAQDAPR
jgi:RimJ/RimL family protein N-acetyltransferase